MDDSKDFRSAPMASPEGRGLARRAWDAYANAANRVALPLAQPAIDGYVRKQVMELVGFWVAWHLYGGFEGLVERAGISPSTVWRKVKRFRLVFEEHPDVYEMPGVTIDAEAFWEATARLAADRSGSVSE